MNKLGKLIFVIAITALMGYFLKPTVEWYFFTDETLKNEANEPLETIGLKARMKAQQDTDALVAAAAGGGALDPAFSYFIPMARENYKKAAMPVPEVWGAADILRYSPNRDALVTYATDHYAKDITALKAMKNRALKLGLDLAGGLSITMQADFNTLNAKLGREATAQERDEALNSALAIIRDRADQFGTVDPIVRRQGTSQILVELPGEKDPDAVNRLIMGRGSLSFHLADQQRTQAVQQAFAQNPALAEQFEQTGSLNDAALLPAGYIIAKYYVKDDFGTDVFRDYVVLFEETGLDGQHIIEARVSLNEFGKPQVTFSLDGEGSTIFARLTENAAANGYALAVLMEGRVRSVASVSQAITGGRVAVSGGFSYKEANDLSTILKTASLPVELNVQNLQRIGPALGAETISTGLKALFFGVLLSFAFLLVYYTGAGLMACVVLLLNLLYLVSLLSFMGFTLTLNSMAGLVLSIAMAVDANILVFQRIKDEIRLGKERAAAVNGGFGKAFWTILDANITTAIVAFCLALLASGPVKGFAVTLLAGIATTLFTSIYVLRLLFDFGTETFKRRKVLIGWGVKRL
jgi:preprotein translocase subunit SecD